jgi:hypothetical protein
VALQPYHQIHEAFGSRDFMVTRFAPFGAQWRSANSVSSYISSTASR